MAEKIKPINISIAVIAIVITLALGFSIYRLIKKNDISSAKSSKDIVISDKDSDELKIKKINKKIELIDEEIEKIQAETAPELEKLNQLYEDFISTMNEQSQGTTEMTELE